jgi:hypothetical protein
MVAWPHGCEVKHPGKEGVGEQSCLPPGSQGAERMCAYASMCLSPPLLFHVAPRLLVLLPTFRVNLWKRPHRHTGDALS